MIPFTAGQRPDGRPDLGKLDAGNAMLCADLDVCGVCGQPLGERWVLLASSVLLGTTEPPMHPPCAQRALRACPHLRNNARSYWRATSPRHHVRNDPDELPVWSFDPDVEVVTNAGTGEHFPDDWWRVSDEDRAAAAEADWLYEQHL